MAGRSRAPGAEVRDKRTSVRWTRSEYKRLEEVQREQGFWYLADIPRDMTLDYLKVQEIVGSGTDTLEKVREAVNLKTAEQALLLVLRQILPEGGGDDEADVLGKAQEAVGDKTSEEVALLALKQARLENEIGDAADSLEKARKAMGFDSTEEAIWALAKAQLERLSSALEKDVAE